MATSQLITLQISDIVRWFRDKELVVNETFQRRSVWTTAAKTYLIDTILAQLPLPKFYLRTKIDPRTQTSVREIVDGQQRVRAICEFAGNDLRLTTRSKNYSGLRYEDLDPDAQTRFLGYTISAEQLLNASDDDVLEVFARLNSYTVVLNPAERRHAQYATEFKWAVRQAAQDWKSFWENHGILTIKERFRMADDALVAEMFAALLEGVQDGGAKRLDGIYRRLDDDRFTDAEARRCREHFDACLSLLDTHLADALRGAFSKPYQLLMLFAAIAHSKFGIPQGQLQTLPARQALLGFPQILDRLADLEAALDASEAPPRHRAFVAASSASTHRIASRRVRFASFYRAVTA